MNRREKGKEEWKIHSIKISKKWEIIRKEGEKRKGEIKNGKKEKFERRKEESKK